MIQDIPQEFLGFLVLTVLEHCQQSYFIRYHCCVIPNCKTKLLRPYIDRILLRPKIDGILINRTISPVIVTPPIRSESYTINHSSESAPPRNLITWLETIELLSPKCEEII